MRGFAGLRSPRRSQQLAALRNQAANSLKNIFSGQLQLAFSSPMNAFTSDSIELLIASTQCEATPAVETYAFAFIPATVKKAAPFKEAVLKKFSDMRHVATRELAESCDDVEVVFEADLPRSSDAYRSRYSALRKFAEQHNANLWNDYLVGPTREDAPKPPSGVKLKMRTEFLNDAVELRVALAAFVLHWSDFSINIGDCDGPAKVNNIDRDIEFEVAESAPALDHLRWYINQIANLHVPAQTLHYADEYTGARLPYHLLEEMEPPKHVIESLLFAAKSGSSWRGAGDCRIHELVGKLEGHLKRLNRAA